MKYNNFSYSIVDTSEKLNIDFSKIANDMNQGRENNDNTKFIVKWLGEQPSELNSAAIYTHQEILEELKKTEWVAPIPDVLQEYLDGL
jgi:uncharacterized protein YpuA (DUF1002 family)